MTLKFWNIRHVHRVGDAIQPAHPVTKEIAFCHFACMKYFWRWLANFSQNYRTNEFLATICTECNNSRF